MLRKIVRAILRFYVRMLDLFFPRECIGCGRAGEALCHLCLVGISLPHDNLPPWIYALYSYKHPIIRTSIWRLKYKYTHDIGRVYGELLYEALMEDIGETAFLGKRTLYLIPLPLSNKRLRERGYNQSELLAKAILRSDTSHILKDGSHFLKRKDTEIRQSHTKDRRARLQNIIGSFYVPDKHLPEKAHFILIDDVVTTGATLYEAKKALSMAGAKKVSAYTIAH